jgi:hypothetical protein
MNKIETLKVVMFLSTALAIVCLALAFVTSSLSKRRSTCIEFELDETELSNEAPTGLRCESSRVGTKVHVTCCEP